MTRSRTGGDRGSAVLETVALLPLYMAFVMAVVVVGKLNNSSANIEAAARSAAREISLARNPYSPAVQNTAEEAAREIADIGSAFCTAGGWVFDATVAGTDPIEVNVEIHCTVDLDQATFLGVPGTREMTASATEIVDRFREVEGGP